MQARMEGFRNAAMAVARAEKEGREEEEGKEGDDAATSDLE